MCHGALVCDLRGSGKSAVSIRVGVLEKNADWLMRFGIVSVNFGRALCVLIRDQSVRFPMYAVKLKVDRRKEKAFSLKGRVGKRSRDATKKPSGDLFCWSIRIGSRQNAARSVTPSGLRELGLTEHRGTTMSASAVLHASAVYRARDVPRGVMRKSSAPRHNQRHRPRRFCTRAQADSAGFDLMASGTDRKYFLVGGKGGVGKTSCSSSLAVKFANAGHPTLLVSTDPAHSLSDSLAQDVTGGLPVAVDGTDNMLYAMEVDPDQAKAEFAAFAKQNDVSSGAKDFMSSVGLGGLADQLGDLKLGELLDTPPPGLDEAIAIAKVVQFIKDEKYAKFTRIVFDTAPTGHTLRLLSLPDFLDASIGKIVRLRQKLTGMGDAVKGLFGVGDEAPDEAVQKLEALKTQLNEVKDLFRNEQTTEFVIVTIPSVLGMSESGRLLKELRKENVPVKRIVINQIVQVDGVGFKERIDELSEKENKLQEAVDAMEDVDASVTEALQEMLTAQKQVQKDSHAAVTFCTVKAKDQRRAMEMLDSDAGLASLQRIEAPLFDMEIRGVPALSFMGGQVWTE